MVIQEGDRLRVVEVAESGRGEGRAVRGNYFAGRDCLAVR